MLTRRLVRLLGFVLVVALPVACDGGRGQPEAPQIGLVSVGSRRLSVTRPPGHICVRSALPSAGARAVCLLADFDFPEAVVSAALEPLDAAVDLVAVLAQPDVAIVGLSGEAAKLLVRAERGAAVLALWVDAPPAGSAAVCTSYTEPSRGAGRLVVHRSVAVGHRAPAAVEVSGGCG